MKQTYQLLLVQIPKELRTYLKVVPTLVSLDHPHKNISKNMSCNQTQLKVKNEGKMIKRQPLKKVKTFYN